jgi:hypothetical protein
LGIVALFLALPACYFPLLLSIPGWLVDLEMFLLISPDHFGDAVVTVTAHGAAYIRVQDPFLGLVWSSQYEDFLDRVMSTAPRSKSVTATLELGFPERFEGVLDHCLKAAILNDGDSERP